MSVCLGIGLTYTLLARQRGARKVIIADLRLTEDAKEAVRSDQDIIFLPCNVTVWKDLQAIIDTSLARFGDVPDVYVASAGVFEPVGFLSGNEPGVRRRAKLSDEALFELLGRSGAPSCQRLCFGGHQRQPPGKSPRS